MMKIILATVCVIVPVIVTSAIAQQAGIKRSVIRTIDYPAGYTTVTAIVEVATGRVLGSSHPSGDRQRLCSRRRLRPENRREARTDVQGRQLLRDIAQVPHDGCSVSGNKLIDTFVIEKGKPLASPRPMSGNSEPALHRQ